MPQLPLFGHPRIALTPSTPWSVVGNSSLYINSIKLIISIEYNTKSMYQCRLYIVLYTSGIKITCSLIKICHACKKKNIKKKPASKINIYFLDASYTYDCMRITIEYKFLWSILLHHRKFKFHLRTCKTYI